MHNSSARLYIYLLIVAFFENRTTERIGGHNIMARRRIVVVAIAVGTCGTPVHFDSCGILNGGSPSIPIILTGSMYWAPLTRRDQQQQATLDRELNDNQTSKRMKPIASFSFCVCPLRPINCKPQCETSKASYIFLFFHSRPTRRLIIYMH